MNFAYKLNDIDGSNDLYLTDNASTLSISGSQCEPIITEKGNLNSGIGWDGEYTASGHYFIASDDTVYLDGVATNLKEIISTNEVYGLSVDVLETDGTVIRQMILSNYSMDESGTRISLTDFYDELATQVIPSDVIDPDRFPSAPIDSQGQVINYCFGNCQNVASYDPLINSIKCYRVEYDATHEYLIGHFPADIEIDGLTYVEDPDGTDVSASCSLTDATIDGKKYYFINYNTDVDYLRICYDTENNTTAGVKEIIDAIGDTFFPTKFTFDTSNLTDIFNGENRGFDRVNTPTSSDQNLTRDRLVISNVKTKKKLLKEIQQAYDLEFYVDKNYNIVWTYLDYANITQNTTYQDGDIITFSDCEYDYTKIINRIEINSTWDDFNDSPENYIIFNNEYSQDRYGFVSSEKFDTNFRNGVKWEAVPIVNSFRTAKYRLLKYAYPWISTSISVSYDDGKTEVLGNILKFKHPKAKDEGDNFRYFQIRQISIDPATDTIDFGLRDITFYYDMIDMRFHLKADRNAGNNFYNWGNNSNYIISDGSGNGATYSTAQTKFRDSSIILDGVDQSVDSIPFVSGDPKNFEVLDESETRGFVLGGWVRGVNSGTLERILSFYKDSGNYWFISKKTDDTFTFVYRNSNVNRIDTGSVGTFTTDTWHFVIFARVNDEFGLYVDGTQVYYLSLSPNRTIGNNTSQFFVGQLGNSSNYWDGYMDDMIIDFDNKRFGLAPNVGLTDTFTVPTEKLYEFPEGYVI